MTVEKREQMNELYDTYKVLLTGKQCSYFEAYYFEDLSIGEIANSFGISRNAVFDQLKRVTLTLQDYEDKLGYVAKMQKITSLLENTGYLDKVMDILKG